MYTWIDLSSRLAENFTVQENVGRWVGGRVVSVCVDSQSDESVVAQYYVSVSSATSRHSNKSTLSLKMRRYAMQHVRIGDDPCQSVPYR